jgi:hypothetical protein
MKTFVPLISKRGQTITVAYDFDTPFDQLARSGQVDCFIVSTEHGFSPLGAASEFFAEDLGIPEHEIKRLADWNRFENDRVTLLALKSRRPDSALRGVILAPAQTSKCYHLLTRTGLLRPYRDFYYNVSYEGIAHACRQWGAAKLGMSHLSGANEFHEDIATCNAEALAHFCDEPATPAPHSFAFVGCCIELHHLRAIKRLNPEGEITRHHPIALQRESQDGAELIHLDW